MDLTVTEGIVSSIDSDGSILTSAKVDAGNSGGLAVDQRGCMVGVPSAVQEGKFQNLGVVIPTARVLEFSNAVSKLSNSN
jgi:S1-C subfamily serine protease